MRLQKPIGIVLLIVGVSLAAISVTDIFDSSERRIALLKYYLKKHDRASKTKK